MFQIYFPIVLTATNSSAITWYIPIPYSRFVIRTVSGYTNAAMGAGRTFTFNDGTNNVGTFTFSTSSGVSAGSAGVWAANSSYGTSVITSGYLKITQTSTAGNAIVGMNIEIDPGARQKSDFS